MEEGRKRFESKHLLDMHKPKGRKKQFKGKGNTEYLRDPFFLTLCYAVTAHKLQGQFQMTVTIGLAKPLEFDWSVEGLHLL